MCPHNQPGLQRLTIQGTPNPSKESFTVEFVCLATCQCGKVINRRYLYECTSSALFLTLLEAIMNAGYQVLGPPETLPHSSACSSA